VALLRHVTLSTPLSGVPERPAICVRVSTSMLGVAAIRSIRYCDMELARPAPRTSIQTFDA